MTYIIIALVAGILLLSTNLFAQDLSVYDLSQFDDVINQWSDYYGNISPAEIKAIIMVESKGNPNATNSSDPSYGLMQVTLPIGIKFANISNYEQLYDPSTNIEAGAGFMSYLKSNYASDYPDEWIQMYNEGEPHFLQFGERVPSYQANFEKYLAEFE